MYEALLEIQSYYGILWNYVWSVILTHSLTHPWSTTELRTDNQLPCNVYCAPHERIRRSSHFNFCCIKFGYLFISRNSILCEAIACTMDGQWPLDKCPVHIDQENVFSVCFCCEYDRHSVHTHSHMLKRHSDSVKLPTAVFFNLLRQLNAACSNDGIYKCLQTSQSTHGGSLAECKGTHTRSVCNVQQCSTHMSDTGLLHKWIESIPSGIQFYESKIQLRQSMLCYVEWSCYEIVLVNHFICVADGWYVVVCVAVVNIWQN